MPKLLAGDILDRMATERIRELWLVPGSVAVYRKEGQIEPFSQDRLFPDDIRQILMNFRSRAALHAGTGMGESGSFSFGVRGVGRFRVSYVMQRGSYAVFVFLTGEKPPQLDMLVKDMEMMASLRQMMASREGLILVTGPFNVVNFDFTGAIVDEIIDNRHSVVYTVESPLMYTLRHRKSVAIQCEVGTDVPTVRKGIENAISIAADVLYLSNIPNSEALETLLKSIEGGRLIIASLNAAGVVPGLVGMEALTRNPRYYRQKISYAILGVFSPKISDEKSIVEWVKISDELRNAIIEGNYEELNKHIKVAEADFTL